MSEEYRKFNAEDYIGIEEDIQGLLRAAADEDSGDGAVIRAALRHVARIRNMSALARDAGLNRGNLEPTWRGPSGKCNRRQPPESPGRNPYRRNIARQRQTQSVSFVIRIMARRVASRKGNYTEFPSIFCHAGWGIHRYRRRSSA